MRKLFVRVSSITTALSMVVMSHSMLSYAATTPSPSLEIYPSYNQTPADMQAVGQNATPGTGGEIVMDFGRQQYSSSTGWGVWTQGGDSNTYFLSNSQIISDVKAFITGYDQTHTAGIDLYVTTNNDNWQLIPGTTNQYEPWTSNEFSNAGTQWASIVKSIPSSSLVSVESGNDIEYWGGITYALTDSWLKSFDSNGGSLYYMLDSGDEVVVESGGNGWTNQDLYNVAYGIGLDLAAPEIYYEYTSSGALYTGTNGAPASGNATDWESVNASYPMYFDAVSSENGASSSLTDTASYDALETLSSNDVGYSILQF